MAKQTEDIALTVNIPFGKYKKGDQITDSSEVKAILASENSTYVVKVKGADAPKPKDANPQPEV